VTEEASYVTQSFQAEQCGQTATKSVRFGETYLPKSLKSKTTATKNELKQEEPCQASTSRISHPPTKRKANDNVKKPISKEMKPNSPKRPRILTLFHKLLNSIKLAKQQALNQFLPSLIRMLKSI